MTAALAVDGAISHDSAAQRLGLDLAHRPGRHVTIPRNAGRRAAVGIQLHRCDLSADDYNEHGGVRITTPLRTVLDCARVLSLRDAIVVADSALRAGTLTLPMLVAAASAARGTGSARIRRAVALADPKAGSVLESVLRFLFVGNGLHPLTQHVVRDMCGRIVAVADFYLAAGRLVVEADGFAFHSTRADLNRDIAKNNAYALLGYRLLRFSWEDVLHRPDYVLQSVRTVLSEAA